MHERYLPGIRRRCEQLLHEREVEGLLFRYKHFWGSVIPTQNWQKVQGYRQRLSKSAMHKAGRAVLEENEARGLLVANDGQAWGEW